MSLIDLQRDLQGVCLANEPDVSALGRLGDPRIFRMYRDMVRRRLYGELKIALRRTHAAAGNEAFGKVFAKFMAERPPRCRFFHDVPIEFAATAEPMFRASSEVPAYVADLLLYEVTRWQVSDLPGVETPEPDWVEFDFDLPTVFHPTVRLLALEHPVHSKAAADGSYARKATYLLLHRPTDADRVQCRSITARVHALVSFVQIHPCSMAYAIKHVSQAQAFVVDQAFLETLCAVLAEFIDNRVVLGSRLQTAV